MCKPCRSVSPVENGTHFTAGDAKEWDQPVRTASSTREERRMATVDHTFTVDASPAVVFAYLTDREKATVWQASLLEAHFTPDAPVHKGTEIHEVRKLLGRKIESTVEVTEFEPDRLFGGRVRSGPVPWQFLYTLEGADRS